VTVPPELVDEFLAKLYYVSEHVTEFELTAARDCVRFRLRPGAGEQSSLVAARIQEVAQKMCRAHRPGGGKVLIARDRLSAFAEDPHAALEERGELFRFGQGRYGLGPRLVELSEVFDRRLARLAEAFRAEPHQFPALIGADVLERSKYLRAFPHSLSLVSHLREDLEAIQNFSRAARWDGDRLVCDAQSLDGISCLLAPAVCFHCYAWLQDSRQPEPRIFTAAGKCFRYESGNLGGLERLWDFTMREIIFVGPQEFVLAERQKAIDESVVLLDEWELSYQIRSANDPFFIEEYAVATFQLAFDLKYEVQALLPYKEKRLAVGSFNFHQDLFGRSLGIALATGAPASTGCAGFGLERLVLAFLAQHGLDRRRWPAAVADNVKRW
jgi:seryl-tRNA synthetase